MCASRALQRGKWTARAEPISPVPMPMRLKLEMPWRGWWEHQRGSVPMVIYWFAALRCNANRSEVQGEIEQQRGASRQLLEMSRVPWFAAVGR